MKILQKLCFILLLGSFSSVYGGDCQDGDVDACRRQAKQGDVNAQIKLGFSHQFGEGVLKDYVMAHMYWNIAAVSGDLWATGLRRSIEMMMSQSQIQEAERMAREWMRKHQ